MGLKHVGAGALMIGVDAFFNTRNERLAELALGSGVPTVAAYKEFAEAGGLLSYGAGIAPASRRVGVYTGRILGGEKPANLPFQLPTELEMVINLKTARQLGLSIPPAAFQTACRMGLEGCRSGRTAATGRPVPVVGEGEEPRI